MLNAFETSGTSPSDTHKSAPPLLILSSTEHATFRRSIVDGFLIARCEACGSTISTHSRGDTSRLCTRKACIERRHRFDTFPLHCLAVSLLTGGFQTVVYKGKPALIISDSNDLLYVLPADSRLKFWIPRSIAVRRRFRIDRRNRSRRHRTLPAPSWLAETRPKGVRTRPARSNFPSHQFLKYLSEKLGYPPEAALAAVSRAHIPWASPHPDRRQANPSNMDDQDAGRRNNYKLFAQPGHPYTPASPSRRTQAGGGLSLERIGKGLEKMRTNETMKTALIEVVYKGKSTLQVADQFKLSAENLSVYASRLRKRVREQGSGADLHA